MKELKCSLNSKKQWWWHEWDMDLAGGDARILKMTGWTAVTFRKGCFRVQEIDK